LANIFESGDKICCKDTSSLSSRRFGRRLNIWLWHFWIDLILPIKRIYGHR
jgi:hypothetical protein